MTILRTNHQQTVLHSEVTKLKAQALTRSDEHRGFVDIPMITAKVSAHFEILERRLAAWQMTQRNSNLKELIDYHGMFTIGASRDNCDRNTTGFFHAI